MEVIRPASAFVGDLHELFTDQCFSELVSDRASQFAIAERKSR
jgi:hypothetical protein